MAGRFQLDRMSQKWNLESWRLFRSHSRKPCRVRPIPGQSWTKFLVDRVEYPAKTTPDTTNECRSYDPSNCRVSSYSLHYSQLSKKTTPNLDNTLTDHPILRGAAALCLFHKFVPVVVFCWILPSTTFCLLRCPRREREIPIQLHINHGCKSYSTTPGASDAATATCFSSCCLVTLLLGRLG